MTLMNAAETQRVDQENIAGRRMAMNDDDVMVVMRCYDCGAIFRQAWGTKRAEITDLLPHAIRAKSDILEVCKDCLGKYPKPETLPSAEEAYGE
jgi:hypothetical protein